MGLYNVVAVKPPIGEINSFVEADSAEKAVAQFRRERNLDEYAKVRNMPPIQTTVKELIASSVAVSEPEPVMPKSADDAIATFVESSSPPAVTELKNFGLGDSDVLKLVKAKLTTVPSVVAYAKAHANIGLKDIPGIDVATEKRIKAAIRSHQNSQL